MKTCYPMSYSGISSRTKIARYDGVDPKIIAEVVARFLGIKMKVLVSPTKWNPAAEARRMAYQLMQKYNPRISRDKCAKVFNRKGSGVFTAEDLHNDQMSVNRQYRHRFILLESYLVDLFGLPRL